MAIVRFLLVSILNVLLISQKVAFMYMLGKYALGNLINPMTYGRETAPRDVERI